MTKRQDVWARGLRIQPTTVGKSEGSGQQQYCGACSYLGRAEGEEGKSNVYAFLF